MISLQQHRFAVAKQLLVAAAAFCGAVVCERESPASCGDYVVIGAEAEHQTLAMQHAEQRAPKQTCRGPQCGRERGAPSSPVPPPSTTRLAEQACALCRLADIEIPLQQSATRLRIASPADGYPLCIDRPPQG
ncbi:MAG: hypothetical protein CMJ64_23825 [Planctomycetaceae bacterium]|nr:hypothetical protein [Planctomycetaceae bacterium]